MTEQPPAVPENPKRKIGRPTRYSAAAVKEFCDWISSGKSLRTYCEQPTTPTKKTIQNWLGKYPEFVAQYANAKAERLETWAEQTMDISDDSTKDVIPVRGPDGRVTAQSNGVAVMRARLRVDTRKWFLARMLPKQYGDSVRTEVTGKDGGPIKIEHDLSGLSDEQLEQLERQVAQIPAKLSGSGSQ
jgi:hypothetical protein